MAQVWAYFKSDGDRRSMQGAYSPAGHWTHSIAFSTLRSLNSALASEGLNGQVDKLAIVAHGDSPGVVEISPVLTTDSMAGVASDLRTLRNYLKRSARVVFFSCQIAGAMRGDRFLLSLSERLPGREIVGFIFANMAYPGFAGDVRVFSQLVTRHDEWSEATKWAKDGRIVRPPLLEVLHFQSSSIHGTQNPSKKCGSEQCPGHGREGDWCRGYSRAAWPSWARDTETL
jgi:hypothetical protein